MNRGADVDGSTSIASFWELISAHEVMMASIKEPFRFSDKSEMKIYSDFPGGKSHDYCP
jgi:hypothetical protein